MREILFRGKDKDGIWHYGQYVKSCQMESHYIGVMELLTPVIPETIGQFYGHTDRNGVKIFEGDVYFMGDFNIKHVVVFHDSGLIGKQIGSSSYVGIAYWKNRIEIIGNIHDNPELL